MELPIVSVCLLLACLTQASFQKDDCQNKDTRCPNMPKHGREVFCQRPWARRNCEQLCGICGDQPLVVKVSCYDVNNRCADMPHDYDVFCARPWAKRNCKKFCRVCVSDNADNVKTTPTSTTSTPTSTTTTPTSTTTTPTTTSATPTTTTTTPTTTTTTPTTITTTATTSPINLCKDQNGVVHIYNGVPVLCEDGWLVFQQRKSAELDFDRSWTEYKEGFGDVSGDNFWVGLESVHRMCGSAQDKCEFRFDLRCTYRSEDKHSYGNYKNFYINSEADKFRLNVGDYVSGNGNYFTRAGDHKQFSTKDQNNDPRDCNCQRTGGFWYHFTQTDNIYTSGFDVYGLKKSMTSFKLRQYE